MVLNVIKGAYPSLSQVDKQALLDTADLALSVERGTLLRLSSNSTWRVCQATDAGSAGNAGAFVFFAFQPNSDLTAQMAGGYPVNASQRPMLAGLAVSPSVEIETDMFAGSPAVGDFMACGNGGKLAIHGEGQTALMRVTKAPHNRWVNNAVAVSGWRLGNNVSVIRGLTMYIPNLAGTAIPAIA